MTRIQREITGSSIQCLVVSTTHCYYYYIFSYRRRKHLGKKHAELYWWLVLVPLIFWFFLFAWWLGITLLAICLWTTWDYLRRGDMAGHITEGMSKLGYVARGAEVVMTGDEDPDDGLD